MSGRAAREDGARYETILRLSAGGMGTVYVATMRGALGFRQIVAIKKPHRHLLGDPSFRAAFVREARLASLIHHANVVDVRDVEASEDEVSLVMEYVEGASLGELLHVAAEGGPEIPPAVAVRIVLDACAGLHAAHELADERGRPLNLVHRDISPQNLLVGLDGVTRVADFGVAKFNRAGTKTTAGHLKGKLSYTAPECLHGEPIDRRIDVFAMGVVLWESLAGTRLFRGQHEAETMKRIVDYHPPKISELSPSIGSALDEVLEMALAKSRAARFDNMLAMASALESSAQAAGLMAGHREVAEAVRAAVGAEIEERRSLVRARLASEPSIASAQIDPVTAATLLNPANPPKSMTRSVERHPWETTVRRGRIPIRDGDTSPMLTLDNPTVDRPTLEPPTLEQPTLEHPTLEHPTLEHSTRDSAPVAQREPRPTTTLRSEPPPSQRRELEVADALPRRSPWLMTAGLVGLLCMAGGAIAILHKAEGDASTREREPATLPQAGTTLAGSNQPLVPALSSAPTAPSATLSDAIPTPAPSATQLATPAGPTRKRPGVGVAPPRSGSSAGTKPATTASESTTDPPPNPHAH
jgi:serine/threonine-protein kinase